MTTLSRTLYKMRRQILTVALLLSAVALLSSLSFAQNISAGCDDNGTAVSINDNENWVTLCSVRLELSGGTHTCVATGSAYVSNTVSSGNHNEYRFAIARSKHPTTDSPGELLIDVVQNGSILDLKDQPVSVVQHFDSVAAGARNFYWLARKVTSDPPAENIDAKHFSMGIVCTDGT
jgi:hypothetical protein